MNRTTVQQPGQPSSQVKSGSSPNENGIIGETRAASSMLKIPQQLYNEMRQHAIDQYPEECCGVLLGTKNDGSAMVSHLLRIPNTVADNRTHRFLITPEDYRHAEQEAARLDREIVGFYHSHPDHPAQPSQFDLDHAFPWWSYVIISVTKGKTERVTSWVMKEDRTSFMEERIEIVGSNSSPIEEPPLSPYRKG